jgi:hypothetical protein
VFLSIFVVASACRTLLQKILKTKNIDENNNSFLNSLFLHGSMLVPFRKLNSNEQQQ